MNIVSIIMQFLAPAIVGKLASALGLNQTLVQKAIAAAIPAILAGLAGKAAQPSGAGALFDILGKIDPGLLGKLGGLIGTPQQKTVAEQGTSMLGSLLGNTSLGALTGALGKFSGAGEDATKGLIGMLAPVVLGTLAQQQKSSGLDAGGVARLLADQKDNIAAALPGDFSKLLGGTGLLDSLGAKVTAAAAGAGAAARTATTAAAAPAAAASNFKWWPWVVVIAAAGLLWWWMFAGRPQIVTVPPPPTLMAGSTDIGGQLNDTLGNMRSLLNGIRDVPSAQAALPKIREAQAALDKLGGMTGQLNPDGRKALAGYIARWLPVLVPLIDSLLANTAIAPLVKPAVDALRARLDAMAKA